MRQPSVRQPSVRRRSARQRTAVRGTVAALALLLGVAATGTWKQAHGQTIAPEITPARIEVDGLLAPGSQTAISSIVVRNTGTVRLAATLRATTDVDGEEAWVRFAPDAFDLDAGGAMVAEVTLHVPRDAPLGPRRFRLRATVEEATDAPGVTIGVTAAVASLLVFEVGWPEMDGAAARVASGTALGGRAAWWAPLVVALAILSGTAAWWGANYLSRFEFIVRRRPPPE